MNLLNIILGAALLNHIFLVQGLGASSLFAYSRRLDQSAELALLCCPIFIVAAGLNLLLDRYLLSPLGLDFLALILFVALASLLSVGLCAWLRKTRPLRARRNWLGVLLLGGNSALIGLGLLPLLDDLALLPALIAIVATALGFAVFLIGFAALRERLERAPAPVAFQGAPQALISASLLAMSLMVMGSLV